MQVLMRDFNFHNRGMQRMQKTYKPGGELKKPAPPPGFIRYRPRHIQMGDCSVLACPNCEMPRKEGDRWGYYWDGQGWADPAAQAAFDQFCVSGEWTSSYQGNRVLSMIAPDGIPLLNHWSRYYTGYCLECGCRLWEHMGGQIVYPDGTAAFYYHHWIGDCQETFFLPQGGQLSLFGLMKATLTIARGVLGG
jgi:hypothetical protein